MVRIGEIASTIANGEIVATVTLNSGVRTYANNGKYTNIHLTDDNEEIKLTVFGENVTKVTDLKVFVLSLLIFNVTKNGFLIFNYQYEFLYTIGGQNVSS